MVTKNTMVKVLPGMAVKRHGNEAQSPTVLLHIVTPKKRWDTKASAPDSDLSIKKKKHVGF